MPIFLLIIVTTNGLASLDYHSVKIIASSLSISLTSSDIRVAMERPISWYRCWLPSGPSRMKINRVGTGTSVRSPSNWALLRRTKARTGWLRKSTSPTRILEASAPGGIFLAKCSLNCNEEVRVMMITFHMRFFSITGFLCKESTSESRLTYWEPGKIADSLQLTFSNFLNSMCPSDAIWRHRSGSTLAQVMACCLTAPSHYLNQCWLIFR